MNLGECHKMRDLIQKTWADHPAGEVEKNVRPDWPRNHLESCPQCLAQAREIDRVDKALAGGLSTLQSLIDAPSQGLIDATIQKLHEEEPAVRLLRRIRRPLRIILWGTFFAFTLLAASALAVALYKALSG